MPNASIFVFDNNSSDDSAAVAKQAGATVIHEKKRGKGFVVASMLKSIMADFYVMVDGDDTYPADCVHKLLGPLLSGRADMVVGQRFSNHTKAAFPRLHVFGNRLVVKLINLIFDSRLSDIMSGYRVFTREVAISLPVVATGFDVETEMTLQLLYRHYIIEEVPVPYKERPPGSCSKLDTFRDGACVLLKILGIFKAYKPLTFFGGLGFFAFLLGIVSHLRVLLGFFSGLNSTSLCDVSISVTSILCCLTLVTAGVIIHTFNFRILEITSLLAKSSWNAKTEPYGQL